MRSILGYFMILVFALSACREKSKVKVEEHNYSQDQLYGYYTPCAAVGTYKGPEEQSLSLTDEDTAWVQIKDLPAGISAKITASEMDPKLAFVSFSVMGADGQTYEMFNGVRYGNRDLSLTMKDGMLKVYKGVGLKKIEFTLDPQQNELLKSSSWDEKTFAVALQSAMEKGLKDSESVLLPEFKDGNKDTINLSVYQRVRLAYWDGKVIRPASEEYFIYEKNHYKALVNWDGAGNFVISNLVLLGGQIVDGKALVRLNNNDSSDTEVVLTGMQGNGYLCSNSLISAGEKDSPRAFNKDNNFRYSSGSPEYGEMTGFAHVSSMYDWYVNKLGPNWSGSQVLLFFTNDSSQIANGPQYQNPSFRSGSHLPVIFAPDKLGNVKTGVYSLENLRTDSDALPHEIGHHFMYQFVGLASPDEHKATLEAFPDLFVMLRYGDPCLAEKICVKGNTICMSDKCLRYANHDITYNSAEYAKKLDTIHKKSMIVTGFFWDLNTKTDLGNDYVTKLALKTMSLLQPTTDFRDVISATFQADKLLAEGKNFCKIWDIVKARKLDFAQAFVCEDSKSVFN